MRSSALADTHRLTRMKRWVLDWSACSSPIAEYPGKSMTFVLGRKRWHADTKVDDEGNTVGACFSMSQWWKIKGVLNLTKPNMTETPPEADSTELRSSDKARLVIFIECAHDHTVTSKPSLNLAASCVKIHHAETGFYSQRFTTESQDRGKILWTGVSHHTS
jgi:hypothetical protein